MLSLMSQAIMSEEKLIRKLAIRKVKEGEVWMGGWRIASACPVSVL